MSLIQTAALSLVFSRRVLETYVFAQSQKQNLAYDVNNITTYWTVRKHCRNDIEAQ